MKAKMVIKLLVCIFLLFFGFFQRFCNTDNKIDLKYNLLCTLFDTVNISIYFK